MTFFWVEWLWGGGGGKKFQISSDNLELNVFKWKGRFLLIPVQSNTRWWFQTFFIFHIPIPGEMIQFDEHLFQMGWFNHQLVEYYPLILWVFNKLAVIWMTIDPNFIQIIPYRWWCRIQQIRQKISQSWLITPNTSQGEALRRWNGSPRSQPPWGGGASCFRLKCAENKTHVFFLRKGYL